jgi:microcompartment protein CcmL/EutN
MTAIGMIETKGLLAAIECADAMLKAADVRLLEKNLAGAGLVTITVSGEVSAVKASVDAAVAAVRRINGAVLISDHVIARPDHELEGIIAIKPESETYKEIVPVSENKEEKHEDQKAVKTSELIKAETTSHEGGNETKNFEKEILDPKPQKNAEDFAKHPESGRVKHGVSQLKKMNVNKLRQAARGFKKFPIDKNQIETTCKKDLIEAIVNAYRQEEEE